MRELAVSSAGETRREPAEHRRPRAGGAVSRRWDAESTVVLHCQVNNFVLYFFLPVLPPAVTSSRSEKVVTMSKITTSVFCREVF